MPSVCRHRCYNAAPGLSGLRGLGQGLPMGDKRIIKIARSAALVLFIGCSALACPAAAQSPTARFKSLFGGKSGDPAPAPTVSNEPRAEENCPPVTIRAGAST